MACSRLCILVDFSPLWVFKCVFLGGIVESLIDGEHWTGAATRGDKSVGWSGWEEDLRPSVPGFYTGDIYAWILYRWHICLDFYLCSNQENLFHCSCNLLRTMQVLHSLLLHHLSTCNCTFSCTFTFTYYPYFYPNSIYYNDKGPPIGRSSHTIICMLNQTQNPGPPAPPPPGFNIILPPPPPLVKFLTSVINIIVIFTLSLSELPNNFHPFFSFLLSELPNGWLFRTYKLWF